LIEEQRGVNRHGSCGLGINETVTRHLEMVSRGISDDIRVPRALDWLVKSWIPERGAALGLSSEVIKELINQTPDLINVFVNCWAEALDVVYKLPTKDIKEDVIYEGAQGLALDETNGIFPYVTRSNTGIQNALRDILRRSKALEDTNPNVSIYYMTRTYTTRHGAGPLIGEASPLEIVGKEFGTGSFIDPTNKPNPWQGTLRFAPLDMYGIQFRINHDLMSNATLLKHVKYKANVCITCMDQSDSVKVKTGYRNPATVVNVEDIPGLFKQAGLNVSHLSFGPTANNVEEVIYA
jgi:adenylosuccinate synthase